jgi:hypothetical protein
MAYKTGSEIKIGDCIYVGTGVKVGRVKSFSSHHDFAELNHGFTARVANTDRGNVTIIDQQPTRVPE